MSPTIYTPETLTITLAAHLKWRRGEEGGVRASLNGASLDDASLNDASLNDASLNDASLNGASLDGASLNGASLDDASLNGASLDGANLRHASGLDEWHAAGGNGWHAKAKADIFAVLELSRPEVPGPLSHTEGFMPIERVREWARSDRGGRQLRLLNTDEPGCVRWGLCEHLPGGVE